MKPGSLFVNGVNKGDDYHFIFQRGLSRTVKLQELRGPGELVQTPRDPDRVAFRSVFTLGNLSMDYELEVDGRRVKISLEEGRNHSYSGTISPGQDELPDEWFS